MLVFYPTEWRENEHTFGTSSEVFCCADDCSPARPTGQGNCRPVQGAELPRDLWARRDLQARLLNDSRDRIR